MRAVLRRLTWAGVILFLPGDFTVGLVTLDTAAAGQPGPAGLTEIRMAMAPWPLVADLGRDAVTGGERNRARRLSLPIGEIEPWPTQRRPRIGNLPKPFGVQEVIELPFTETVCSVAICAYPTLHTI